SVAVCYLLAIDEELESVAEMGIVPLGLGEGTHEGGVSIDVGWIDTQWLNVLPYQLVKQLCTCVLIPELVHGQRLFYPGLEQTLGQLVPQFVCVRKVKLDTQFALQEGHDVNPWEWWIEVQFLSLWRVQHCFSVKLDRQA